jgi:DNA polymerase III subunit epsilon
MKLADPCGCFPTGRHYPGIAHLMKVRAVGIASEFEGSGDWVDYPIAFIDTETTGRDAAADRLVEVGVVLGHRGQVTERRSWLINPGRPIPKETSAIHGITDDQVANEKSFAEVAGEIVEVLRNAIPAAYNAAFDRGFLLAELERAGVRPSEAPPAMRREVDWIDPLTFARELYKDQQSRSLGDMAARLGIEMVRAHRATDDAEAALQVLYTFAKDPRVPRAYGGLVQEQRRLLRQQDEARKLWRKPS